MIPAEMTDDELIKRAREMWQWKHSHRTYPSAEEVDALLRAADERDALAHDIARHVQIASAQATEIAALRKRVAGLEDVVEDALARGEAEILAAYARRRLKRADRELAKEAQTT